MHRVMNGTSAGKVQRLDLQREEMDRQFGADIGRTGAHSRSKSGAPPSETGAPTGSGAKLVSTGAGQKGALAPFEAKVFHPFHLVVEFREVGTENPGVLGGLPDYSHLRESHYGH
ncbi:hypothetical protein FB451DRAFT_1190343 [Mycena latifolia]|nr:hypothetical protein FB451DRAFT_1190343 [Mycena latifolia]